MFQKLGREGRFWSARGRLGIFGPLLDPSVQSLEIVVWFCWICFASLQWFFHCFFSRSSHAVHEKIVLDFFMIFFHGWSCRSCSVVCGECSPKNCWHPWVQGSCTNGSIGSCMRRQRKGCCPRYGYPKPWVFPLIITNFGWFWLILGYPHFGKSSNVYVMKSDNWSIVVVFRCSLLWLFKGLICCIPIDKDLFLCLMTQYRPWDSIEQNKQLHANGSSWQLWSSRVCKCL